jgi:hypothetical protein
VVVHEVGAKVLLKAHKLPVIVWLGLSSVLMATLSLGAQAAPTSVSATQERAAILNALRQNSQRDLGRPIRFVVKTMTVHENVAFIAVMPERANGRPIDVRQTPICRDGACAEWDGVHTEGLLYKSNRRWIVEHYSVGSTDLWYDNQALCPRYSRVLPFEICKPGR